MTESKTYVYPATGETTQASETTGRLLIAQGWRPQSEKKPAMTEPESAPAAKKKTTAKKKETATDD